jgi:hypothetical protein
MKTREKGAWCQMTLYFPSVSAQHIAMKPVRGHEFDSTDLLIGNRKQRC